MDKTKIARINALAKKAKTVGLNERETAERDALRVLFKKICEDPEYLADMKKAGQPAEYMDGEAFAAYIAGQQAHAQEALSAAGLLKK